MLSPNSRLRAFLELARPANILTAHADILVGFAASGAWVAQSSAFPNGSWFSTLFWLLLATTGLYGGGVVLNDVFDAKIDAKERPERAIPSGRVSLFEGSRFGVVLLGIGLFSAAMASNTSFILAGFLIFAVLFYNSRNKHHSFWGPLNMGLCRALNLLLGISAIPSSVGDLWFLGLFPILYIGAITMISQGEVHGGSHKKGQQAVMLVWTVLVGLLLLGFSEAYHAWVALPFALLFSFRVLPPFMQAARDPKPEIIQKAVMMGVLSLIFFNAALAAGYAGWLYGLAVLALFPISRKIGKAFAIT